ncbi:MAG: ATP-binding protein [Xanthomonadales bacterium]|nr:ATP-binding protein [Xanthomonadales bacterium]
MTLSNAIRTIAMPLLVIVAVVALTEHLYRQLHADERDKVARITEAESYAARSRLVRNVNTMIRALREVRAYWAEYGRLPRDQWASDASIEVDHFNGIEFILWSESNRSIRYVLTTDNPVLDYRPTDEEWESYKDLLEVARSLRSDTMAGPFRDENGAPYFIVYFLPDHPTEEGILISRVNAQSLIQQMLSDDSPGYEIAVRWRDELIYAREFERPVANEEWIRSGMIRNDLGALWEVTHQPGQELIDDLHSGATDLVRFSGFIIAVLMGLLMIETHRAERKARNAIEAETAVRTLNAELEQEVKYRTREVAERSQDLVTITESVAHDLRNPLNSISANVQLVELQYGEELDDESREIVEQIKTNLDTMTGILDRLLSLSVVFSTPYSTELVDMRELVLDVFEEMYAADPEPPARLEIGEAPPASGELILLRTLLMNLVSNALKYSRDREQREIRFDARREDGQVIYSVSDNGVGFDSDAASRLFKAFERLDERQEGLGLGLDIAARVVHRYRGRIWAEAEPGEGATFYFTLGPESADGGDIS